MHDGTLAHTNHYVSDRMLPYEGDVDYAARSDVRYSRALSWLARGHHNGRDVCARRSATTGTHPTRSAAIPGPARRRRLSFGASLTSQRREITFGRGNPCDSEHQHYAFD